MVILTGQPKIKCLALIAAICSGLFACTKVGIESITHQERVMPMTVKEKEVRVIYTSEAQSEYLHDNCKFIGIVENVIVRNARTWAVKNGANLLESLYQRRFESRYGSLVKDYDFAGFHCAKDKML